MTEPLEEPLGPARLSESEKVLDWRLEQFLALGFDYPVALSLAVSDADIGKTRRMIRRGCSLELAARIA